MPRIADNWRAFICFDVMNERAETLPYGKQRTAGDAVAIAPPTASADCSTRDQPHAAFPKAAPRILAAWRSLKIDVFK